MRWHRARGGRVTLSIVARDAETGQLGVALQTAMFAAGAFVPWVRPGVGAVASQAIGEMAYGPRLPRRARARVHRGRSVGRRRGRGPDGGPPPGRCRRRGRQCRGDDRCVLRRACRSRRGRRVRGAGQHDEQPRRVAGDGGVVPLVGRAARPAAVRRAGSGFGRRRRRPGRDVGRVCWSSRDVYRRRPAAGGSPTCASTGVRIRSPSSRVCSMPPMRTPASVPRSNCS